MWGALLLWLFKYYAEIDKQCFRLCQNSVCPGLDLMEPWFSWLVLDARQSIVYTSVFVLLDWTVQTSQGQTLLIMVNFVLFTFSKQGITIYMTPLGASVQVHVHALQCALAHSTSADKNGFIIKNDLLFIVQLYCLYCICNPEGFPPVTWIYRWKLNPIQLGKLQVVIAGS